MLGVADPVILTCRMASGQARDNRGAGGLARRASTTPSSTSRSNTRRHARCWPSGPACPMRQASVHLPAYTTRLGDAEIDT